MCLPMSLLCSASWVQGSDYNLVPTPKTVPESNSGAGNIFCTRPDRFSEPLNLMYNGYHVFPRGKERPGRDAKPSPPSSDVDKKEYSYSSTTLWAVRPVQSLSACTKVHFTLLFTLPRRGMGTAVAQWLRCCATNRKVTGSILADII